MALLYSVSLVNNQSLSLQLKASFQPPLVVEARPHRSREFL